jgi:trehalose 6-phosphate phosphatase
LPNSPASGTAAAAPDAARFGRYCLFLDVDGTLVEFAATPAEVRIDPSLAALIDRGSQALNGALAIVSGRTLADLDRLFAPNRWPAAGLHGLERRDAHGRTTAPSQGRTRLETARAMLEAFASQQPGVLVEDKGASIAVHYRRAPELESHLTRLVEQLVRDLGSEFDLQPGACVLELRIRGPNKADAIQAFLAEPPFAGRIPLFAGDDLTDLDAFAAVERAGGLSISVGNRVRGRLRFASPRELRTFLADLLPPAQASPGSTP